MTRWKNGAAQIKSFSVRLVGVLIIGLLIFGYVGCSSSRKYWTKENFDPEQYRKDESYCKEQAGSGSYKSERIDMKEVYKQCMYSLGYIHVEERKEREEKR